MSASSQETCPLCGGREGNVTHISHNRTADYDCKNCGHYILTMEDLGAFGDDAWKLAAYVLERSLRGITPTFYPAQNLVEPEAPVGSVGVDAVIESFPKAVAERLDRALVNLSTVTHYLGEAIRIPTETCNPLLLAQNASETLFIIQHLESEGYLQGKTKSLPTEISITGKGLMRVSDLQRGLFGPSNKQAFVAMSFDPSLQDAWSNGLKLGIEDGGYEPLRVDAKEHNDKICDVIVAEIRKSKFLVADFTLHRGGVYFEAGLMMGLGRPVIFTCQKDELGKAHFDTRQYNHIEWETPAELREKLKRRIQATVIP